jgi:outer membrane protein
MIARRHAVVAALLGSLWTVPAAAQDGERVRVALGPQLTPSYPGADGVSLRPFGDLSRAKGDEPFVFEAADDSFSVTLLTLDKLQIGPAIGFEGNRSGRDTDGALPGVGFTVEVGGFAQYDLGDSLRLRGEVRQGVGGHHGLVANIGADYVARRGDDWLFSIGPRVTLTNDRYNRAFFGVAPGQATSGLPAYDARGGVEAVGVTAGYLRQFGAHWGVYGYAKYDRLVGDAAGSPVVARYGSKDQPSVGLALTYSFRRR